MASTYNTESSGWSESSSTPVIPDFPQSAILMEIAKYARDLAPQMLNWAQTAYSKGEQLSDDLLNRANIYANPARIAQDMGQAQAHVMQGADAARQSAVRDLEKYGIDPSSGRYAALDMAERNKAAAAAAGAGNVQRNATEAAGREMRRDAMQARNQNNQFGAAAMRLPNDYLQTAMALRYPPLGQNSQSRSEQQSKGTSSSGSSATSQPSSSARSSGGGGGGPPSLGGLGGGGGLSGWERTPSGVNGSGGVDSAAGRMPSGGNWNNIQHLPGSDYEMDTGYYDPNSYARDSYDLSPTDRFYDPYSAYDPGGQVWGTQDFTNEFSGWGDQYLAGGDWQQGTGMQNYDWGSVANPLDSGGGSDAGGGSNWWDGGQSGSWADSAGYDAGGASSWGGDWGDNWAGDYEQGGPVDDPTGGGFVSPELSPSGGAEVDDVDANLNAGEFVIPRDVAAWKGQEFFQKLIEKSRQARAGAPAKPSFSMG